MHRKNQVLVDLFEPDILALGYVLLGIELHKNGDRTMLRIYIDKADGISIGDCMIVSQQITGLLDVENPIAGQYDLEVSSLGLDGPIFTNAQFGRYIDKKIKLRLCEKLEGRRHFTGYLVYANNSEITMNCDQETIKLPLKLIDTARLVSDIDIFNGCQNK